MTTSEREAEVLADIYDWLIWFFEGKADERNEQSQVDADNAGKEARKDERARQELKR